MNKSEIFKNAHRVARETVKSVGDYMIAFSLALKEIYSMSKETAEDSLIKLGGRAWEKFGMKRVYLSLNVLNSITNFGWNLNEKYNSFYYESGKIIRKCTKRGITTKIVGLYTENGFENN